jgi:multidrug transporter EmrE-like cation transporter
MHEGGMKLLLAIFPTILLTSYSQLIVKWRVMALAGVAGDSAGAAERVVRYLVDPYIISAFVLSFFSAIAWFYVAERYPVSIAFPTYVGVLFAVVTIGGAILLNETISAQHLLGLALILGGVVVISQVT